jgi:ubiquitin carboxyl-terminal hydrolase 14
VHESGDEWIKYDDDVVSVVNIDKVLDLKGGGDFHMTYLCLYRKLEIQ